MSKRQRNSKPDEVTPRPIENCCDWRERARTDWLRRISSFGDGCEASEQVFVVAIAKAEVGRADGVLFRTVADDLADLIQLRDSDIQVAIAEQKHAAVKAMGFGAESGDTNCANGHEPDHERGGHG